MKHADALEIANHLLTTLRPHCERIEIAGSVRRGKPEVKDIEIVAAPKRVLVTDMFGACGEPLSALDCYRDWSKLGEVVKAGTRYKQIALMEGINLDLFIVWPPAQWGVIFTIRTGPAEFSRWIVTARRYGGALGSSAKVQDGAVWQAGKIVPMPEEIDFLSFLGLGWIEPGARKARVLA